MYDSRLEFDSGRLSFGLMLARPARFFSVGKFGLPPI